MAKEEKMTTKNMDEALKEKWSHFERESEKTRHFEASQVFAAFLAKLNEPSGEDNGAKMKTGINHNITIAYYLKYYLMDVVLCGPVSSEVKSNEYINSKFVT